MTNAAARRAAQTGRKRFSMKAVGSDFMYGEGIVSLVFRYDRAPSVIEDAIRRWRLPRPARKGNK